jgi:hypothetical protein
MGMRSHLHEWSAAAFFRFRSGAREHVEDVATAFIDKSWYDFHFVFKSFGPPLSLAIDGDYHPPEPELPPDLDSWLDGGAPSDFYFACISPDLVKEINDHLGKISEDSFSEWDDVSPGGAPEWRPYFDAEAFEELKRAYRDAAAHGNALVVMIC